MKRSEVEKAIESYTGKSFKHNVVELLTRTLNLGRLSFGKDLYLTDNNTITIRKNGVTVSFYYADIMDNKEILF